MLSRDSICFLLGATQNDEDPARCNSTATSQNPEASDVEDDISVGDNRSETSTPKGAGFEANPATYQKKGDEENDCDEPAEYNLNNRIPNSNYNSPFKEDDDFENRTEERMKYYDSGLFHLYRSDREGNKDEHNESGSAFGRMGGMPESIYGRSMDLSKSTFQSQLLAGFAASVMAGNTQRDSPESTGIIFVYLYIEYYIVP